MAKEYHCSHSPWLNSPSLLRLSAVDSHSALPIPGALRPTGIEIAPAYLLLIGAIRRTPVGPGPPPPDTIGFWAAAGGRHSILILGAGASERLKLPRFAACVDCRIGDRAGRAPVGVCHWRIYDYGADRRRPQRLCAASFRHRHCSWIAGYLRHREHQ